MSETKWDDRRRTWWRLALARRMARLCDVALVSGSAAGEYAVMLGIPRENIFRQYGVVGNEHFAAAARHNGHPGSDPPYFLACGRFIDERKNFTTLLDAYARYRARYGSGWGLVLCGDGPDRARLEQRVATLSLPDVRFSGFLQLAELAELYGAAGCFIHPAVNEAWGLVVNEAMAAGLPVLVSRRAGCAYDLVHERSNGRTFDPYDAAELAELMGEVAAMPRGRRREMGLASQTIVDRFSSQQFARGLADALRAAGQSRAQRSGLGRVT
jgi:glycosyltransferase involved in cell wall biosynthesis